MKIGIQQEQRGMPWIMKNAAQDKELKNSAQYTTKSASNVL
jgi:hypothetical protein